MPKGDRTGPYGRGPMTGRAMGYCSGYNCPGHTKEGLGGRGLGRGYRWRQRYFESDPYYYRRPISYYDEPYPQPTTEEEREYLEEEIKAMKERLQELSKQKKGKE